MQAEQTGAPPKLRVLVADDEQIIVDALAVILELGGYGVCALCGGEAAQRFIHLLNPEFVLTDLTTSGVPSAAAPATAAQALHPRCRIFLFTGTANLHNLLRANSGEDLSFELITVPIAPEKLLTKVGDTLCSEAPALLMPIEVDEENVH